MQKEKLKDLIFSYLAGECSLQQKIMLEKWITEDPSHRRHFDTVKKVWDVTPDHDVGVNFEEEWERMSSRIGIDDAQQEPRITLLHPDINTHDHSKTYKAHPVKYLIRVAAIILIITMGAYYFTDEGRGVSTKAAEAKMAMQEIKTANGERASMKFSDGSKIMLNSMSSVRFPKVFNGSKREIYLDGEAFFQVIHNEEVPFIVHVNGVTVKDIGTEFNINTYNEEGSVEVVVRKGKVSVRQNNLRNNSDGKNDKLVFLSKGQRTFVKSGKLPSKPETVSLKPYMAWVNGRMVFDGTPMRDVIKRLKRAYDLQFQVRDSTLLSEELKASFKRETPEKVLGIIAFSLGLDYELHRNTVILKSKNKGNKQ